MLISDYALRSHPLPMDLQRFGYAAWLWNVKEGGFDCPVEPLIQEFWKANAESRLANGLLLPTWDYQQGTDLLILVTQKRSESLTLQFGGMTVRERYQFFKFVMELGLPNTNYLAHLHPFVRIPHLRTLEETFRLSILPSRKATKNIAIHPFTVQRCFFRRMRPMRSPVPAVSSQAS